MIAWLADTLVATSALMLLVLAVREPVRRQFGATAAYSLWLLPAARMAMPPITHTVERIVPAAPPADAPLMIASMASAAPLAGPSTLDQLGGWSELLIAAWVAGTLVFLALGLVRYQRQRRVALDGAVQLARLGSIRLVRSHAVRGPIAFGILDRVIAVPEDFDRRFDDAQRRLALDHELSHHRSGDIVTNHIAFVLLGLQWFNPLAWLSHNAFRFDQEAACDARVLDKACPDDRATYGRTIAKAASGKALLFASALDQQQNLHRRLKSMLTNPTPSRRLAGKLLIVGALAIALPLTATRAIQLVDVAAPTPPATPTAPSPAVAPLAPLTPVAPLAPLTPAVLQVAPVAPLPPLPPLPPVPPNSRGHVMIDGLARDWSEIRPQEKARIRASLAEARRGLAATRIDRAAMRAELREAMAEMKENQSEMRRDLEEARRDIEEAVREIDHNAVELRRAGQDPEKIKASVRASLKAIDVDAIARNAMAGVDPALIERSLAAAEASIDRAQAEIDAADRDD